MMVMVTHVSMVARHVPTQTNKPFSDGNLFNTSGPNDPGR